MIYIHALIIHTIITMYSTSLSEKVGNLVERDFVSLDENTLIADTVKLMKDKGFSFVFVTQKSVGSPIGIVTERDVLYRVVAENKDPFKTTLKEIMSSPLITIDEESTVANAISLMRSKRIRRLAVKRSSSNQQDNNTSTISGVITLISIVGSNTNQTVDLAEVELPSNSVVTGRKIMIICPYCQSKFEDKDQLSRHIDRIHVGSGLLEGDLRRW
ncbi:MAG TPA: CBS domain-containing protein [Nitrososphaeraceae archaeon]|nr:CBS domain-containing protein [Nitrososphaeraceae archaeon]